MVQHSAEQDEPEHTSSGLQNGTAADKGTGFAAPSLQRRSYPVDEELNKQPSLDTNVALRLFSGALDDLGNDLTNVAVDEDSTQIKRVPGFRTSFDGDQRSPTLSRNVSSSLGDAYALGRSSLPIPEPDEKSLSRLSSIKIDNDVASSWVAASLYLKSSWQYKKTRRAAAAAVLSDYATENIPKGGRDGIRAYACSLIKQHQLEDTFYIYNLGQVWRMFSAWKNAMPRVTPYYAVKCNPELAILKLLFALGAGFDCASKAELATVLDLGVPSSRIIFAHPCKRQQDIKFAASNHVEYTTFDTESELDKIAQYNARFRCVLRIRADDPDARVPLGLKYGANLEDTPRLLKHAKELGLQVVGVSFHVGSGAKNLNTFSSAIASARHIFDMAELMGFNMELLDIGGGFTGHFDDDGNVIFGEIASTINKALEQEFPPETDVRIIAEPGRYFAETSATLFTPIYGQRDRPDGDRPGGTKKDYWITDGLYGSFNCILYDGQNPEYQVVRSPLLPDVDDEGSSGAKFKSTVWGPTCDSADCVYKDIMLPQLRNGDWLMFPNAGAYTVAGACDFNGINMTRPHTFYVFSDSAVDLDSNEQDPDEDPDDKEE